VTDSIVNGRIIVKRNARRSRTTTGRRAREGRRHDGELRLPLNDKGTTEFYSFAAGAIAKARQRLSALRRGLRELHSGPQLAADLPLRLPPGVRANVLDNSIVAGIRTVASGWSIDLGTSYGQPVRLSHQHT